MTNVVNVDETPTSVLIVESDNTVTITQVDTAVSIASPGPQGPAPTTETYTVSGGTDGTQPTFTGDPLFTGQYVRVGDLVHFEVQVDMDNITSFGTGQYYVTLPFNSAKPIMVRNGCLHDINTGLQYHISGHVDAVSDELWLYTTDRQGNRIYDFEFEQGEPITLTTADNFHISGTYIAEPAA